MKSVARMLFASVICAVAVPAIAAAPQPFTGRVDNLADADTYLVVRRDGSKVKIRLHYADAPEIAHKSGEVDQPGGRQAMGYIAGRMLADEVRVYVVPVGKSYDRIVADVYLDEPDVSELQDVALLLVSNGYAQLDPRFKPPAKLTQAESHARELRFGLWAFSQYPTPPWEWRKLSRDEQRQRKQSPPAK